MANKWSSDKIGPKIIMDLEQSVIYTRTAFVVGLLQATYRKYFVHGLLKKLSDFDETFWEYLFSKSLRLMFSEIHTFM